MIFASLDLPTIYSSDESIFDEFNYPDVINTEDDKQKLIDGILMESEGMECRYTDPDILKNRINIWSKIRKPVWDRFANTESYFGTYNPTENVFEDTTITRDLTADVKDGNKETRNISVAY